MAPLNKEQLLNPDVLFSEVKNVVCSYGGLEQRSFLGGYPIVYSIETTYIGCKILHVRINVTPLYQILDQPLNSFSKTFKESFRLVATGR